MRYFAFKVGAAKDLGAAIGVAINGINIQVKFIKGISLHCQGPNDAGDVSIDEGGFQLACGGHVTPPTTNLVCTSSIFFIRINSRPGDANSTSQPERHNAAPNRGLPTALPLSQVARVPLTF